MDENKDQVKDALDHLDKVEVDALTDQDLDSVAGGTEFEQQAGFAGSCNSTWCCSN